MPRQLRDAPENLAKQRPCQVTFRELQGEIPGVPDQPPARLEQPLLKAREGPLLDGDGEHQSPQQVAKVVGDDAEQQTDLVGPEAVTGKPCPVGRGLAFLDPLLSRAALIVEAHDGPLRPGQGGDDETHPGEEFAEVMLDLCDHPAIAGSQTRLTAESRVRCSRRGRRLFKRHRALKETERPVNELIHLQDALLEKCF